MNIDSPSGRSDCIPSFDNLIQSLSSEQNASQTNALKEEELSLIPSPVILGSKIRISQSISSVAGQVITALSPELVLGSHRLFQWDAIKNQMTLSQPFQELLQLLIELKILEEAEVPTLKHLHVLLQKPQGEGGLLSKRGFDGSRLWDGKQDHFSTLFTQLGLTQNEEFSASSSAANIRSISLPPSKEARFNMMQKIFQYLLGESILPETICLLGPSKLLCPEDKILLMSEMDLLSDENQKIHCPEDKILLTSEMDVLSDENQKIHCPEDKILLTSEMDVLSDENQKIHWKQILMDEAGVTEAIAYALLWKSLLRNQSKEGKKEEVVFIQFIPEILTYVIYHLKRKPFSFLPTPRLVDHCIILGGSVTKIAWRIQQTFQFFLKHGIKAKKTFLLGSARLLSTAEKIFLEQKIEGFKDKNDETYWKQVFTDNKKATEANACALLWDSFLQNDFKEQITKEVIFPQSTCAGFSYEEGKMHRMKTDVKFIHWAASYYSCDVHGGTIFALAEESDRNLLDIFKASILIDAKREISDYVKRIISTTFYFILLNANKTLPISMILNNIACHVLGSLATLDRLEEMR